MSLINVSNLPAIGQNGTMRICHVAYDGCSYYFTIHNCNYIYRVADNSFLECFHTEREYNYICYDYDEKCFWVSEQNRSLVLYKLDMNMQEVYEVSLECEDDITGPIMGISYSCCEKKLVVATCHAIMEVHKSTGESTVVKEYEQGTITGVLCLYHDYFYLVRRGNAQYVYHDNVVDTIIGRALVTDILINICSEDGRQFLLDYFILRNASSGMFYRAALKYSTDDVCVNCLNLINTYSGYKCSCQPQHEVCECDVDGGHFT